MRFRGVIHVTPPSLLAVMIGKGAAVLSAVFGAQKWRAMWLPSGPQFANYQPQDRHPKRTNAPVQERLAALAL
jgi:hypothetical protein